MKINFLLGDLGSCNCCGVWGTPIQSFLRLVELVSTKIRDSIAIQAIKGWNVPFKQESNSLLEPTRLLRYSNPGSFNQPTRTVGGITSSVLCTRIFFRCNQLQVQDFGFVRSDLMSDAHWKCMDELIGWHSKWPVLLIKNTSPTNADISIWLLEKLSIC